MVVAAVLSQMAALVVRALIMVQAAVAGAQVTALAASLVVQAALALPAS